MSALDGLNYSSELSTTPSRKRKRQFKHFEEEQQDAITTAETTSCFTNAAFSSTPKKILAKRRIQLKKNKENEQTFPNLGLGVNYIAETTELREESNKVLQNPYEVLRKPPKKKRLTEEIACFENPALNLELPEKLFNPFEVVREITPNKNSNCFSNPALNLKVEDVSILCNPFEVQREAPNHDLQKMQVKNEDHDILLNPFKISSEVGTRQRVLTPKPCKLRLGLPFVPRVGCRIDFEDFCMSQLTPSKLLAEKLVFSPLPKGKVSLGSIGEESTMDIGKELDRYQQELENSINEAKLRKTGVFQKYSSPSPPDINYQIQIVDNEKSKYIQKLCGISEDSENEEIIEENNKVKEQHVEVEEKSNTEKKEIMPKTNPFRNDLKKQSQSQRTESAEVIEIENIDELYGCSDDNQEYEDSFDFKTPAPFIRAYAKPNATSSTLIVNKESLGCNKSDKSSESDDHIKKSMNVKTIIRKSIRKLMHTHHNDKPQQTDSKNKSMENPEREANTGFMNAIRQSLRRKTAKKLVEDCTNKENEISIIDCTERTIKLKSGVLQTEYIKIEDLTNEKKYNLRSNQLFKSVFHKKHEEYKLTK